MRGKVPIVIEPAFAHHRRPQETIGNVIGLHHRGGESEVVGIGYDRPAFLRALCSA